jgi:TatD DNase family protein
MAEGKKLVALGETGLDYHYANSSKKAQRAFFISHIKMARELSLPLIVHSRDAESDTIEILKGEGAGEAGGVLHCFSGSERMAEEALAMGFYISFSGIITFPKSDGVRAVAGRVRQERLLLETDCPYLAPQPHRGKRSEPAHVVETARKMAELKGLSLADIGRITTLNAEELFGLVKKAEPEAKIAYAIRNSLYLNITNRCTNYCTFCAKFRSYAVKGHYLRLRREPDFAQALAAIGPQPQRYDEIVFCGFGEPLIRIELVKKIGLHLKKMGCRIRVDTDGLANLAHGRNVLPELKFVDVLSVSMNAPDSETYGRLCRTPYGDKAFPAILWFLREAKKHIPKVVATVVAVPGLDREACRKVAEEEIGVAFRVREYDVVG